MAGDKREDIAPPGFPSGNTFVDQIKSILYQCWNGLWKVDCSEPGVIKFYNYKGKLVDECPTGYSAQTKPLVTQPSEPTKEQVAAGVCMWRKTPGDMCLYTVKVDEEGGCEWFSSDKKI